MVIKPDRLNQFKAFDVIWRCNGVYKIILLLTLLIHQKSIVRGKNKAFIMLFKNVLQWVKKACYCFQLLFIAKNWFFFILVPDGHSETVTADTIYGQVRMLKATLFCWRLMKIWVLQTMMMMRYGGDSSLNGGGYDASGEDFPIKPHRSPS